MVASRAVWLPEKYPATALWKRRSCFCITCRNSRILSLACAYHFLVCKMRHDVLNDVTFTLFSSKNFSFIWTSERSFSNSAFLLLKLAKVSACLSWFTFNQWKVRWLILESFCHLYCVEMQPKVLINMSKWIWQLGQKRLQIWQYVFLKGHKSPKNNMFSEVDLLHCHPKKSVLWSDPKILPRSSEQWHSTPNRFYRRRIQPWKPHTGAQCW